MESFTNMLRSSTKQFFPSRAQPAGGSSNASSGSSSPEIERLPTSSPNAIKTSAHSNDRDGRQTRLADSDAEVKIKETSEPKATLQKREGQIKELKSMLEAKEEEIEARKVRYQDLLTDHETQAGNVVNLTAALQNAEGELRVLRRELAESQQALIACKDDIFRLQPKTQLSDSDVLKAFESICQEVVNWIDEEIDAFETAKSNSRPEQIFSANAESAFAQFLRRYPERGEYLVQYTIHLCLYEHLFGPNIYLFGLPSGASSFLQQTEQSMMKLNSVRDFASIRNWRSDTFQALAATTDLVKERKQAVTDVTEFLFDRLSKFFLIVASRDSKMRLLKRVVRPAAALAGNMQESGTAYDFSMYTGDPFSGWTLLCPDDVLRLLLIDVKTRKNLKADSGIHPDRRNVVGEILMPLEPKLCRIDEGNQETLLRRSTYLVQLRYPLQRRHNGSR